ncbi:MAG: GIY-YIG nuclease family protein [Fimbriimonadaceae bacterium]
MEKGGYTYIITNHKNGTLYTGVTSDLIKRIAEHKSRRTPGFATRYGLNKLVWYETFPTIEGAIAQEKRIKEWNRSWKVELIEKDNPNWLDLSDRF